MEKEALVLDASVIVKWFCDEEYTDIASEIRDKFLRGNLDIFVPELMFYEVSNAVRYNKAFSEEDRIQIIEDLFSVGFNVIASNKEILSIAMKLAVDTNTPIYDNVYLAVGRLKNCHFITTDKEYVNKSNSDDVLFISDWSKTLFY